MKKRKFKELTSTIHLHTAAINQTPVLAFHGSELVGSGIIMEITNEAIKINDHYYFREICRFVYAKA
ncbi:hypothetical protein [Paenibacillus thalictri]|uniref:Uncharacterized protein n=1 Tax=Paenibacillus thalictri TaxID=2527873 RepID=A0A4Q9DZN7_9BACL|nr:hypothetical protein [Paenibacillus thalictri]TBL81313.1 hypothetical protein EYB31_04305 [Paenibacillus thalictri]